MLDVLANIAQILGFGLQSYEAMKDLKHPNAAGVFATLNALADTSTSWKDLHMKYHSLHRDIQKIVEVTTDYNRGDKVPKRPNEVAPTDLRKIFYSGMLHASVVTFAADTRKSIRKISEIISVNDPRFLALAVDVKASPYKNVVNSLTELHHLREDVLKTHENFLKFLQNVSVFMGQPNWGVREVRFFIDHRTLLDIQYPNVINYTDGVLMQLLDMFIEMTRVSSQSAGSK